MAGMRWKCAKCYDYDLCTPCYMSGKHIAEHAFVRYDTVRTRYVLLAVLLYCRGTKPQLKFVSTVQVGPKESTIVWHKLLIVADEIIPTIVELVYPLDAVPERWKPEGSFQEQKWSGVKSGRKKSMLVYKYEHLLHNACDESAVCLLMCR